MNERIRELAEQAGVYTELLDESETVILEKFAELIVQESVQLLGEDDGATHHKELLFEHFGVKL